MANIKNYHPRYTVEEIAEALRKNNGMVSLAARSLHITRDSIYKRMRDHPILKEVLKDARESMIDLAESALRLAILNGEPWAVALALKTIGKGRGYVERIEQTGLDGKAQRVEIYLPENTRDPKQIESEIVDADTDDTD